MAFHFSPLEEKEKEQPADLSGSDYLLVQPPWSNKTVDGGGCDDMGNIINNKKMVNLYSNPQWIS